MTGAPASTPRADTPRAEAPKAETPRPVGTRAQLHRLEELLSQSEISPAKLSDLAEPERLALLFEIEIRSLLRTPQSPPTQSQSSTAPTPAKLLTVARDAAMAGVLPLATPASLRAFLDRLEVRIRDAGAWARDQLMWWQPLPTPTDSEQLWAQIAAADRFSSSEQLVETFATKSWLALPQLLTTAVCSDLHDQLEAAYRSEYLALERAGVGAGERVSSSRSDAVLYLTGHEPHLLHAAPLAAAWIQWLLNHLGDQLAKVAPERAIFPPAKVMLARYPAPSAGYHPHLDNPGGDDDNGRSLTLVLYLNSPEEPCRGGEIALWDTGQSTTSSPTNVFPANGGSAILFDSRAIPHQVRPLRSGPARWALTLWFNDTPQRPPEPPLLPEASLTDVLLPIPSPPLPAEAVLFHELDDTTPAGTITVRDVPQAPQRVGIVSTVYRAGVALENWCRHHLGLGIDHLVLIFDHLDEPAETELARRLIDRYPADRLTVWDGTNVAKDRWPLLDDTVRRPIEHVARSGASNHAIAARQALNASAVLAAARLSTFDDAPLDWLLHLDADELFALEGAGRGGATLREHFAAASHAGLSCLRYVNHELLHRTGTKTYFKLNPRVAASKLGAVGWSKLVEYLKMSQTDPRPYFTGYFNGKSAVAVAHGANAAGVHGWSLEAPNAQASRFLAGPCVLHYHLASRTAFRAKYLAVANSDAPPGSQLFEPSPLEVSIRDEILALQRAGTDPEALAHRLDQLHARRTSFSDDDIELLESAGLITSPDLEHPLPKSRNSR